MDENQRLSVQQNLERLLPSMRGQGRRRKHRKLHRVGAYESPASTTTHTNPSFATHRLTPNGRLQKYGDQKLVKIPSKPVSLLFFHVKPCDFRVVTWFMQLSSLAFHNCRLKFSEQKQKLTYFEPFYSRPKGI